jgi:hypothetical protein
MVTTRKNQSALPVGVLIAGLLIGAPAGASPDRAHELAGQAASQTATQCTNVTTSAECHSGNPTGCSNAQHPRYDAYLNFLKNQQPSRDLSSERQLAEGDFAQLEDAIPAGLSTRDHANFADTLAGLGEGNIQAVVGYLYFVEDTAVTSHHRGETCNCQLRASRSFDFHLGIGFDPALAQQIRQNPPTHDPRNPGEPEQTSIVAEMTPHTRAAKWTVARLNRQRGKAVKVIGQLVLDNVHLSPSADCGFLGDPATTCWRASAWEIHPITQFFVCKSGVTCTASSPDSDWVRLEDLP